MTDDDALIQRRREYYRAYEAKNKEKRSAARKARYWASEDVRKKHSASYEAWRQANKDRHRERNKRWYNENKERVQANERKRRYGVSKDEWETAFTAQGNACAICKTKEPNGRNWATDHCHNTGKFRGVLCTKCNTLIGLACDDPTVLAAAIEYVTTHGVKP